MTCSVRLENVTLGYDRHPAVHHVSAALPAGSLTALVGPNGAGKSTLLKAIAGRMRPATGRILGVAPRRDVALLPQRSQIDCSFPLDVEDVVAMGLWREIGAFGAVRAAHRARVRQALAAVGLTGFEKRSIGALSGGQLQRVLFARLLLQDAALILLDEPFAAVDRRTVEDLLALIEGWHRDGRTVLVVLHDLEVVRRVFPRTLLIARELIAEGRTADVLTRANLARARAASEAFDEAAPVCRRAA